LQAAEHRVGIVDLPKRSFQWNLTVKSSLYGRTSRIVARSRRYRTFSEFWGRTEYLGTTGQSWQCRRSVDCTTAMTGRPKEPESTVICAASARPFEACLRTALPCTRVHPRISFTRLDQVRELPELRGSPGGMTSATGCTEFTLGTVMRSIFAPVLISGPQHYPPRVSSTDTLRVPLPSPLSRDKSGAAVPRGFVSLDLYSSFAR